MWMGGLGLKWVWDINSTCQLFSSDKIKWKTLNGISWSVFFSSKLVSFPDYYFWLKTEFQLSIMSDTLHYLDTFTDLVSRMPSSLIIRSLEGMVYSFFQFWISENEQSWVFIDHKLLDNEIHSMYHQNWPSWMGSLDKWDKSMRCVAINLWPWNIQGFLFRNFSSWKIY